MCLKLHKCIGIHKFFAYRDGQANKYPGLARMLELESRKSDFKDAFEYLTACKEKPELLKVRMARIRDEPDNWSVKEFGR